MNTLLKHTEEHFEHLEELLYQNLDIEMIKESLTDPFKFLVIYSWLTGVTMYLAMNFVVIFAVFFILAIAASIYIPFWGMYHIIRFLIGK